MGEKKRHNKTGLGKDASLHPYKLLLKNLSPTGFQQALLPHFLSPPQTQTCASETIPHLSGDAVESTISLFISHQLFGPYVATAMVSSNIT